MRPRRKGLLTLLRKAMTTSQEGYDSEGEDGNAAKGGQIETDSDAIATLKLQLELEIIKAMR